MPVAFSDLDLYIVDSSGDAIGQSATAGTAPESILSTLAANQQYTIQVQAFETNDEIQSYTLAVTCDDGTGGTGGNGGTGGGVACAPGSSACQNGTIWSHFPCCEQPFPDQPDACDGTESTVNPDSCSVIGGGLNAITHKLSVMTVQGDCNVGYDLDSCNGTSCFKGGLAPSEGINAIDNAVAALAPTLEGVGGNLNRVNQAFSDVICGRTDDDTRGTCWGGGDDGDPCTSNDDCTPVTNARVCEFDSSVSCASYVDCLEGDVGGGECVNAGTCNLDDYDCSITGTPADIRFVVDVNAAENCANVTVVADGEASAHILNLSDDGCLSGALGTIPLTIGGIEGNLANTTVRMTVSGQGFSDGLLGATMDDATAAAVMEAMLVGGGALAAQVLDIDASTPPENNTAAACNALSATLNIAGYAMDGAGGNGGDGGGG